MPGPSPNIGRGIGVRGTERLAGTVHNALCPSRPHAWGKKAEMGVSKLTHLASLGAEAAGY